MNELELKKIGNTIQSSLPPGVFFSLLVFSDKGYSYVTNTSTEKMAEAVKQAAKKLKKGTPK